MKSLRIDAGKDTPIIDFNVETNVFNIKGKCHPENITIFFDPIMQWLDDYFNVIDRENTQKLQINLQYDYINSSSFKYQTELLRKIYQYYSSGVQVEIVWHYEKDDDDMRDSGIELFEMFELKMPHKFVAY